MMDHMPNVVIFDAPPPMPNVVIFDAVPIRAFDMKIS